MKECWRRREGSEVERKNKTKEGEMVFVTVPFIGSGFSPDDDADAPLSQGTNLNSKNELAASPSNHFDTVSAKPILAKRSIKPYSMGWLRMK